ncbi:hypothetical protein CJI57_04375, partial [Bifidobacteriaceae bacterium WP012]
MLTAWLGKNKFFNTSLNCVTHAIKLVNMSFLRLALAQIDTCVGNIDSNVEKVVKYATCAANNGANMVVFPEMTLTGYPIEDL